MSGISLCDRNGWVTRALRARAARHCERAGRRWGWLFAAALLAGAAPAAALVYDFQSPAAAVLEDLAAGTYVVDGVPLAVEAGSIGLGEDEFVPGGGNSTLALVTGPTGCQAENTLPLDGLGVDSDIPAGTGDTCDDIRLTALEAVRLSVAPGFEPTLLVLSQFTYGEGPFEVAHIYLDDVFWAEIPGQPSGTVAIPLPPGAQRVTVTMTISTHDPDLLVSSDPGTVVASLAVRSTRLAAGFDVKPRGCPNPLNPKSQGKTPAAILGSAALDVRRIDRATIRVAGVAPQKTSLADVAAPFLPLLGKTEADDCTAAGPDGHRDLVLHLDTQHLAAALAAQSGPLARGQVLVVPLTANLTDGTPLSGEDVVVIVGKP